MEPIQFVIIAISITLTGLFLALGVQVWFILREARTSAIKVNKMLDDMGKVSGAIGDGATSMTGLLQGIKTGLSLVTSMKKKGEENE